MKSGEMVALLQAAIAEHGDLELVLDDGVSIGEAGAPEIVHRFDDGTASDQWHRSQQDDPPPPVIVIRFGEERNYSSRT